MCSHGVASSKPKKEYLSLTTENQYGPKEESNDLLFCPRVLVTEDIVQILKPGTVRIHGTLHLVSNHADPILWQTNVA
jgi:hypothetical protein